MNRNLDPNNRFDRAYLEFSQESRGPVTNLFSSQRFSGDSRTNRRYDTQKTDDRFACLRSDYRSDSRIDYRSDSHELPKMEDRFSCLRSDNCSDSLEAPKPEHRTECTQESTEIRPRPRPRPFPSETPLLTTSNRPPGLPLQRKKALVQTEEQFPSLPTSPSGPKTPKTPKWVAEPLRDELEFIPLTKPEPKCVSVSLKDGYSMTLKHSLDDHEPEQMYKVVRKISGGSWSDRVKYCGTTETSNETEELNYDEDGFPMIHGIEAMVNSFS